MATRRSWLGRKGEEIAAQFLQGRGYSILETNYHCRWGEIDIVALKEKMLVFVEVKTRRGERFGAPEEGLTRDKARRLIHSAHAYLQAKSLEDREWRIDLVTVPLDAQGKPLPLRHYENVLGEDGFV